MTDYPTRDELDEQYTWDLTRIYATPADWAAARDDLAERVDDLHGRTAPTDSPAALAAALDAVEAALVAKSRVTLYARLRRNEDTTDDERRDRYRRSQRLAADVDEAVQAVRRRVQRDADAVREYRDAPALDGWDDYLDDLLAQAPHTLDAAAESVVAHCAAHGILPDDGWMLPSSVPDHPDAATMAASELVAVDGIRRIGADGAGVVRLHLSGPFLALELADHGAVLRSVRADPTDTTLVVDVPESVDLRHVTDLVRETVGDVDLRSKRTSDRTANGDPYSRFLDALTERQLEVTQTAYYSGFFESPRANTGEEVAETLGISPPAFYQHIRTVQRKLFSALFDEAGLPAAARSTRG